MDGYTIAFGIRNVTHIEKALSEAYRLAHRNLSCFKYVVSWMSPLFQLQYLLYSSCAGLSFSSSCAVSWIKLSMFYHVCLVDGSEISLLSHQLAYFKSFCSVDGPKILLLSHQLICFRVLKRGGRFLCLELSHVDVPVFKEM